MIYITIVNIIIYEKNYANVNNYFDYVMICMIMKLYMKTKNRLISWYKGLTLKFIKINAQFDTSFSRVVILFYVIFFLLLYQIFTNSYLD